jgi:phenylalanine-4-hydroxylase
VLFEPAWGRYDMAVGARISSVFGGVADRQRYQLHKPAPRTTTPGRRHDQALMQHYAALDELRSEDGADIAAMEPALSAALDGYPAEWLLRAEVLRALDARRDAALYQQAAAELRAMSLDAQHRRALALVLPDLFD